MNKLRFLGLSAPAAAILFNNWLIGIGLNHRLFLAGGSVSEFSAGGQPYRWVFRSLDIAAGALLAVTAMLIFRLRHEHRYWRWIALLLLILGLGDIADALLPLPCSGTLDSACNAPVHVSLKRISIPDHVISSGLIALMYILLPALGFLYARWANSRRLAVLSTMTLLAALLFLLLLGLESGYENGLIGRVAGYVQEIHMLLLGGWLILLTRSVSTPGKLPMDETGP